jgi:hypothetical protein
MPTNTPGAEGRCRCGEPAVARGASARGFRAAVEGDELVLRMPIDLLANAANKHPDLPQGLVKDERAYAEWVAKNFVGFDEDGAGFTSLYRMLDRLTMAAYEGGNL